jgi:hypothetical protein
MAIGRIDPDSDGAPSRALRSPKLSAFRRVQGPGPFADGEWRVMKLSDESRCSRFESPDLWHEPENAPRRLITAAKFLCLSLLGTLLAAAPAAAQLVFDAPRLQGPNAPSGFGAYWLRTGALPGDGSGVLVTWAPPALQGKMTVRGGGGHGAGGTPAGFGGIDVRVPMMRSGAGRMIDVAWTAGLGASMGEYMMGTLVMGASAGREWSSGSVAFGPYLSAGIAADMRMGEEAPDEEFVVQPAAELGVDLSLDPARRVTLRAGASLGDRKAFAVGAMVRAGG